MVTDLIEEPEVIPATKSRHGYLASRLSENIFQKEDGSLVVVGCPIARTGFQKYSVKDLPKNAADLGIDVSNPEATIELYRPESEVFALEFLASLNGAPICDGHPPNGDFVDKDNFKKLAMGHIQNPRRGPEALEDGEWPLIADLIISAEPLIGKVLNKSSRDNSLGYDFGIFRDGDKICQGSMAGNHNAVVPSGRAGDLISIMDAMPEELANAPKVSQEPLIAAAAEEAPPLYTPIVLPYLKKEKQTVAKEAAKTPAWLRRLMGKELIEKARATDADPEALMEHAEEMLDSGDPMVPPVEDKAKDDAEPPKNTQANEFKSESEDARKRMHDALDRALDAEEIQPMNDKKKAKDADVEELKKLLDEFLSEEEKEPEHAADEPVPEADPSELEAVLASDDDMPCPDCGEAHDSEECPGQEPAESGEENIVANDEEGESPDPDSDDDEEDEEPVEDKKKAMDKTRAADARDGVRATLKMLRPAVARCGDKAVHAAFNRALDSYTKSSRVKSSMGGYGKFASAARACDKAPRNPNPTARAADASGDQVVKLQKFYDDARSGKGGK